MWTIRNWEISKWVASLHLLDKITVLYTSARNVLNVGKHQQQQQHGNPELARSIISGILNFTPLLLASIKSSYRTTDSLPRIFKKSEENNFFVHPTFLRGISEWLGFCYFASLGGFFIRFIIRPASWSKFVGRLPHVPKFKTLFFLLLCASSLSFLLLHFLSLFLSISIHGGTNYTTNVSVFPRFRMGRLYFVTTGCIFFYQLRWEFTHTNTRCRETTYSVLPHLSQKSKHNKIFLPGL